MEVVAALVALGPVLLLLALVILRTRQLLRRPDVTTQTWPRRGGDASGVREPRRPLVPAGSGRVASPLPADDSDDSEDTDLPPGVHPVGLPMTERLAS